MDVKCSSTAAGTFVSVPLVDTYVCHESVNRATGEEESCTSYFSLPIVSKVLWVGGVFSSIYQILNLIKARLTYKSILE